MSTEAGQVEFDWQRAVDALATNMSFGDFMRLVASLRYWQILYVDTRNPRHLEHARNIGTQVDDVLEWGFR